VYVTKPSDNNVRVIDTGTKTVIATVAVGSNPLGISVHPDGTKAYVANFDDDTVSVIDTTTNSVVATLNVGDGPVAFGDFIGPLIGEVQLLGLSPSRLGIYKAGDTVTFTATAIGPEPIYYKFWYRAGYGTPAYASNTFMVMQDFSISNSANYTFTLADNYVVLVWATDDPNNVVPSGVPLMGMNINVEN
jgi:YVTN family beta-propeller protein